MIDEHTTCWAVWNYWETGNGVRREHVLAVCATQEQAIQEAARIFRMEASNESLPHFERSRLFVRPVAIVGLMPAK